MNKLKVNLKKSIIMKKQILSFVMMLALVVVTGSAFAAVNSSVIQGGTYPYSLNGIGIVGAGSTVEITYANGGTISGVTQQTPTSLTPAVPANTWVIPVGSTALNFNVAYSASATSGNIVVKITDGVSLCTNQITLAITVALAPTINLALAASESSYCQTTSTTTNNVAASSGSVNTMTFTVSQVIANAPATYTWEYKITLPNVGLGTFKVMKGALDVTTAVAAGQVYSGIASTTTTETYTITFNTTTGLSAQSLLGTLSAVKLTDTGTGAGIYNETVTTNNAATVTVKTMPSIGVFN